MLKAGSPLWFSALSEPGSGRRAPCARHLVHWFCDASANCIGFMGSLAASTGAGEVWQRRWAAICGRRVSASRFGAKRVAHEHVLSFEHGPH
eukprot:s7121_g1.t1